MLCNGSSVRDVNHERSKDDTEGEIKLFRDNDAYVARLDTLNFSFSTKCYKYKTKILLTKM